jgi:hypothetical protein
MRRGPFVSAGVALLVAFCSPSSVPLKELWNACLAPLPLELSEALQISNLTVTQHGELLGSTYERRVFRLSSGSRKVEWLSTSGQPASESDELLVTQFTRDRHGPLFVVRHRSILTYENGRLVPSELRLGKQDRDRITIGEVFFASRGRVFASSNRGVLVHSKEGDLHVWHLLAGSSPATPGAGSISIYEAPDGTVYIGSFATGLSWIEEDGKGGSVLRKLPPADWPNDPGKVSRLAAYPGGGVLVLGDFGIYRLDEDRKPRLMLQLTTDERSGPPLPLRGSRLFMRDPGEGLGVGNRGNQGVTVIRLDELSPATFTNEKRSLSERAGRSISIIRPDIPVDELVGGDSDPIYAIPDENDRVGTPARPILVIDENAEVVRELLPGPGGFFRDGVLLADGSLLTYEEVSTSPQESFYRGRLFKGPRAEAVALTSSLLPPRLTSSGVVWDGRMILDDHALLELIRDGFADSVIKGPDIARVVPRNAPISFSWNISGRCAGGLYKERLNLKIGTWPFEQFVPVDEVRSSDDETTAFIKTTLSFPDFGRRQISLVVDPGQSDERTLGKPVVLDVGRPPLLDDFGKQVILAALIMHALIWFGLLAAAGRSKRAVELLFDDFWAKTGAHWYVFAVLALRTSPFMRRWCLGSYRAHLQALGEPRVAYVPVPLRKPDDSLIDDNQLLQLIDTDRRVWIQGRSGMGKSTLLQSMFESTASRIADSEVLPVPVHVRARDVGQIDSKRADALAVELLKLALEYADVRLMDPVLLRRVLESGDIVLMVDGVDEVSWGHLASSFARVFPRGRFVITSQAEPETEPSAWVVARLPASLQDHAQEILAGLLGPEKAERVMKRVWGSPAAAEIRSGYDISLLADLASAEAGEDALPASRFELYTAMVSIALQDRDSAARQRLAHFAWLQWLGIERSWPADDAAWKDVGVSDRYLIRHVGHERLEFRHDQMRSFLAAEHLAPFLRTPETLLHQIREDAVWRKRPSEQRDLWHFLLARDVEERVLEELMKFAEKSVEAYWLLAAAVVSRRGEAVIA